MDLDPLDERRWGDDDISRSIDEYVSLIPDRPRMVLALLVSGIDSMEVSPETLRTFAPLHFDTHEVEVVNGTVSVIYLGFDEAEAAAFFRCWTFVSTLETLDEIALYIDGKAQFRVLSILDSLPPPGSIFSPFGRIDEA